MTQKQARVLLGVGASASQAGIRRAFKRLALRHHPDHNRGDPRATERFVRLCLAYDILTGARAAAPEPAPTGSATQKEWVPPWVKRPEPPAPPPTEYNDGEPIHYPSPEDIAALGKRNEAPSSGRSVGIWLVASLLAVLGALAALEAQPRAAPPHASIRCEKGYGVVWGDARTSRAHDRKRVVRLRQRWSSANAGSARVRCTCAGRLAPPTARAGQGPSTTFGRGSARRPEAEHAGGGQPNLIRQRYERRRGNLIRRRYERSRGNLIRRRYERRGGNLIRQRYERRRGNLIRRRYERRGGNLIRRRYERRGGAVRRRLESAEILAVPKRKRPAA